MRLHAVKVIACRTKSYEKYFKTIITSGVHLEKLLIIEGLPKLEKLNILIIKFFDLYKKRSCPLVFLSLHCKLKVPEHQDKKIRLVVILFY